uniref:G-protein coupled receptors family 1 profile domain-containing protein n=1 Tax=Salarias fasciatus TaxID=181472 RepID=A0A672H8P6_SALFA
MCFSCESVGHKCLDLNYTTARVNSSGSSPTAVDQVLVPILDGLILVTGLLGQSLVITILKGRRRRGCQPPHGTDTLLLALSAADLLLLLCLPFHTSAITLGYWPFGSLLCKAVSFLGVACSCASVFTLAALAVTRYLTVVHPTWAYRSRMRRRVKLTVALLWVPASALAAPQFAFRTVTVSSVVYCFAFLSNASQLVYSVALFLCGFALPLGIIVLMYAKIYCFLRHARELGNAPQLERYQTQVTHTSALLVLVFTFLWLPSYALMFSYIGGTVASTHGYKTIGILARLLASSVGVVNPILYGFMSQKFRRELLQLGRVRWAWCKSCMMDCPRWMNRDMVQPNATSSLHHLTDEDVFAEERKFGRGKKNLWCKSKGN